MANSTNIFDRFLNNAYDKLASLAKEINIYQTKSEELGKIRRWLEEVKDFKNDEKKKSKYIAKLQIKNIRNDSYLIYLSEDEVEEIVNARISYLTKFSYELEDKINKHLKNTSEDEVNFNIDPTE